MARNPVTPVTPVTSVEPVRNVRVGQRESIYYTHLEEWRLYSQLLAAERRERERAASMDRDQGGQS
nr:hypothetical protein [uncultured Duganella sp.]